MRTCFLAVGIVGSVLCVGAQAGLTLDRVTLVRGKVIAAEPDKAEEFSRVTVQVEHVYAGASEHRGRTFEDFNGVGPGTARFGAVPPLRPGDVGLWVLRTRDGKLEMTREHALLPGNRSTRKHSDRFREEVRMAEAVEQAFKADPKDRPDLFRKFIADRTPEVAIWAAIYGIGLPDGAGDALAKEWMGQVELSIPAQIGVEQALTDEAFFSREHDAERERRKEWLASPRRAARLRAWMDANLDEFVAGAALDRLDAALQHRELAPADFVALIRTMLANRRMPFGSKEFQGDVGHLLRLNRARRAGAESFELMVFALESMKHQEIRVGAVHGIHNFSTLTAAQLARLVALREKEKDKDVAAAMDEAIAKFKSP
jgi:hypothetical protein